MPTLTQARPLAAEHLRRQKLDVCYSSGVGSSGCSTVTSAAARGVTRWWRLQLSLLRIYACGSVKCAALAALTSQLWLLNYLVMRFSGVRQPFGVATS